MCQLLKEIPCEIPSSEDISVEGSFYTLKIKQHVSTKHYLTHSNKNMKVKVYEKNVKSTEKYSLSYSLCAMCPLRIKITELMFTSNAVKLMWLF